MVARAWAIVGSQGFRVACASATCRRVVPLLAVIDGVVLDVTADLVYETAGKATIVAYDIMPYGGDGEYKGVLAAHLAHAYEPTGNKAVAVNFVCGVDGTSTRFLTREPHAPHLQWRREVASTEGHRASWNPSNALR